MSDEKLTVEQIQGGIARLEAWDELRDGPVMMRKAGALSALRALLAAWEERDDARATAEHYRARSREADAEIEHLAAEVEHLNKLRVHCEDCGADYAATGVEAGCPCKLTAKVEHLRRGLVHLTFLSNLSADAVDIITKTLDEEP